jgi:predicted ATPase
MPLPTAGFVRAIRLKRDEVPSFDAYPFSIPAIRTLDRLKLHPAVTFLIGENGMGKSTLIEALALRSGLNAEGGSRNFNFKTRASHSDLHRYLVLEKSHPYPKDVYFLRAESFYNVATEIERLDEGQGGPPIGPAYSDRGLHEQSHGQSFFALLMNRLRGDGFYIFDEPEAALSPKRQMSALVRIDDLVKCRSQLVIATHSPILLAYPDAVIYELSDDGIHERKYEETDNFRVTRDFLNRHEKLLSILLERLPLRE